MKLKYCLAAFLAGFILIFSLLVMVTILFSSEDSGNGGFSYETAGLNVSPEVLALRPLVEKYAAENGISEHVNLLLAIIEGESKGQVPDVMQSSESLGLPPNSLGTEDSIKQGCKYFASLIDIANAKGCDLNAVIQAYNYGPGFLNYVASRGGKWTFELSESFSKTQAKGVKVTYTHPIAVAKNGGYRYNYGNMFYVLIIQTFLTVTHFDDALIEAVMNEALKYQGWRYVFGGASPKTSFDCSGLTQWCYGVAGIQLPRTAQLQYNVTQRISPSEAKPGDLVFFHSTYSTSDYITHIGIYVGDNRMYHAGNPIGYANLGTTYWTSHFAGFGRVKQ